MYMWPLMAHDCFRSLRVHGTLALQAQLLKQCTSPITCLERWHRSLLSTLLGCCCCSEPLGRSLRVNGMLVALQARLQDPTADKWGDFGWSTPPHMLTLHPVAHPSSTLQ
jgi:hypothetical protein